MLLVRVWKQIALQLSSALNITTSVLHLLIVVLLAQFVGNFGRICVK